MHRLRQALKNLSFRGMRIGDNSWLAKRTRYDIDARSRSKDPDEANEYCSANCEFLPCKISTATVRTQAALQAVVAVAPCEDHVRW